MNKPQLDEVSSTQEWGEKITAKYPLIALILNVLSELGKLIGKVFNQKQKTPRMELGEE